MITAPRLYDAAAVRARFTAEAAEACAAALHGKPHGYAFQDDVAAYWERILAIVEDDAYWLRVAGLTVLDDLTPVTGPDGTLWPKAVAP
jgi:hypothetical protein